VQKYKVVFDDGPTVDVELKSRDIAKAERLGVDMNKSTPVVGSYALAFVALQRMKRTGAIDFELPKDSEALEDIADLEMVEEDDDEGEGSAASA
jgi:hypothetical protein